MRDWAAENARLRLDRDAMNDAKRREAETVGVEPTHRGCSCTAGHVCRQNSACPRLAADGREGR